MLDFKELPQDGQAFEQMVRELLFSRGLHVQWSGRGTDGGRDLLCKETLQGVFSAETKTWLIQCKHNAHGGKSVGIADLDSIVDSCEHHEATGYVLACSTQPSSGVVERLESITDNPRNNVTAMYLDAVALERMLSTPGQWAIAQRFMPKSAGLWKIYATEKPNDFVAHYKGYVFHLTNRIGSRAEHHLSSIEERVQELESLDLPAGHLIRPRAIWYDDKGGGYTWYVDYMYPQSQKAAFSKAQLLYLLHDGYALDDGQVYSWDIDLVEYSPLSDHYDSEHYDYYVRYLPNFLQGSRRENEDWREVYQTRQQLEHLLSLAEKSRDAAFTRMVGALGGLSFLKVVRAINAQVESIHRFERRFVFADIVSSNNLAVANFFSALLIIQVSDESRFQLLLSQLPIDADRHFRAARVLVFVPVRGLSTSGPPIYDLTLNVNPTLIKDQFSVREELNAYFCDICDVIERFASTSL